MDNGRQPGAPGPVMDVLPPAGASPSSKPVITNNQPLQRDPMMATGPSSLDAPITAPAPVQPELRPTAPSSVPTAPQPARPAQPTAEPLHKLAHQEPFFGHVGKHKKNKTPITIVLLLLVALGVGAYLFLTMS